MPPTDPAAEPERSVVGRWLVRRLLPTLALLGGCVALLHLSDRAEDRTLARQSADGTIALQYQILERELEVLGAMVRYLANQGAVRDFLGGSGSREAVEADLLAFCKSSDMFDQLRILDHEGREIVRVNYGGGQPVSVQLSELQEKSDRYYFRTARDLPPSELYVSPFDLNVEHDRIEEPWKPVFRLATSSVAGGRGAVVVVNYLGSNILERLRQAARASAGWSVLVNEDGYYLEGPTPRESWGFMFDAAPTFAGAYPRVWSEMRDAESGTVFAREGMFAFRRFPGAGMELGGHNDLRLRLVNFVPEGLLYADSRRSLGFLSLVAGLVGILSAGFTWRLAQAEAVRAAHEQRLEASEARLRVLSVGLLNAQESERKSLSRDLHDELGQIATAVTIDLKQALRRADGGEELVQRALASSEALLATIHAISSRLRTSMLDDLGLEEALTEHCSEFTRRTGIPVEAEIAAEEAGLPSAAGIHVYRIVQESLNNVARHAGASAVRVRVVREPQGLSIEVTDDGAGFDPELAPGTRLGLLGMRERVELLGGRFGIESGRRRGTTVRAWIPSEGRAAEGASA